MGLEHFFERAGKWLFHRTKEVGLVEPTIPPWQKRLLEMQEEGALPVEQMLVLTSSLFMPGVDEGQRQIMYEKIAGTFRTILRDKREELARAGDPNSIMSLMSEVGEEYKGNHDAQVAAQAYYLKLGMRPLRDKFHMLEEYARILGIDPYTEQELNSNENN